MKIKKGDTVLIIKGKDAGKTAKVIKVWQKEGRVTVEGLNIAKKHVRPKRQGEKGQIVEVPRPLFVSNVKLICTRCGKATRVRYRFDGEIKKRMCKKCENFID